MNAYCYVDYRVRKDRVVEAAITARNIIVSVGAHHGGNGRVLRNLHVSDPVCLAG
ncbi:MAG: hypothetical protein ACREUQ_10395 [Burkholderiales bacterium]